MKVILPDDDRARAARRRDRARRCARDRAEAREAGRARARPTGRRRTCGCRSPTARGLQILTTRDTQDPDALCVLRHSAAHLLAEAAGDCTPASRSRSARRSRRLLLRLRVPRARSTRTISRRSRPRSAARSERGAPGRARRSARDEARARFQPRTSRTRSSSSRPPRARSRCTRRASSPTSAAGRTCRTPPDQGVQADVARRRVLARRRAQHPADAHLRHRVLQPEGSRRAPRAAGAGARARSPPASAAQLDLFHLQERSPGSPFWHPKGMVDLERRSRTCAGARTRGAATTR